MKSSYSFCSFFHILIFICIYFLLLLFAKFEEMNSELEENKELAENRLIELQKLQQDLQNVVQENNNMKVFVTIHPISIF